MTDGEACFGVTCNDCIFASGYSFVKQIED